MLNCVLCNETMTREPSASEAQPMHRECALRSVMGGIGHLLDHEHFCLERHDPDAGLDYRMSALLVDELCARQPQLLLGPVPASLTPTCDVCGEYAPFCIGGEDYYCSVHLPESEDT